MCLWLYATRIPALKRHSIAYDPHRPSEEFHAQLPAQARWKADKPDYGINAMGKHFSPFKRPDDAEHLFDGLRKAGLPE
jgi:hypothetical protein